ncbi:hypothetical protein E2C01_053796 [Portunus trituberculatus]|uniref:Uncharacterized protein n=1 Tax=Portunus trituberculatus TaxID=210409 RepID=A0A5B7GRS6_PORTR|nr:hypothetical protein [Portunus trituberculatus]
MAYHRLYSSNANTAQHILFPSSGVIFCTSPAHPLSLLWCNFLHTDKVSTGCSAEKFNSHLDKYLWSVPDELPVPHYTSLCRAPTNPPIHNRTK